MNSASSACLVTLSTVLASSASMANTEGNAEWVAESNGHAHVVLETIAEFAPEAAGSFGVDGYDEAVFDLRPKLHERSLEASRRDLAELERRLTEASHPLVRQDLEILIKSVKDNIRTTQLEREHLLPYFNMSQTIFQGVRALIDPQIPRDRYPAAVVRIRKYAGLVDGYEPITELAKARSSERFDVQGLLGPFRGEVEQDLERSETFIDGLKQLLESAELEGWEQPYGELARQLRDYDRWIRAEILPRARDDFRLPAALYADALRNWGVDDAPEVLIQTATQGYMDIRNEMTALAPLVAEIKGYDTTDYREVIRRLKETQIPGDALLAYYRDVLAQLEQAIREHDLLSLPEREAGIRIASAAETAAQPSAHLETPRLIGNTGEFPSFVLPQLERNADGSWKGSDDTYEAGTWTLTAHEARPGHELQFSSMIETGVSITRAIFAFNSANVEGWGLYAEAIAKPYMPLEGQLISLQYRLARAARMFLDPMLNLGMITPEEARRLLLEDVVLGETWAQTEIERYTYRIPGQATAYYYGYIKLQSLRTQTELALRDAFEPRAFHDFILSQGLLPPELLKKAVMQDFVPAQLEAQSLRQASTTDAP